MSIFDCFRTTVKSNKIAFKIRKSVAAQKSNTALCRPLSNGSNLIFQCSQSVFILYYSNGENEDRFVLSDSNQMNC